MLLKAPEVELIAKLRAMIRAENDPEVIVVFMQTIAELERQRKKRISELWMKRG